MEVDSELRIYRGEHFFWSDDNKTLFSSRLELQLESITLLDDRETSRVRYTYKDMFKNLCGPTEREILIHDEDVPIGADDSVFAAFVLEMEEEELYHRVCEPEPTSYETQTPSTIIVGR